MFNVVIYDNDKQCDTFVLDSDIIKTCVVELFVQECAHSYQLNPAKITQKVGAYIGGSSDDYSIDTEEGLSFIMCPSTLARLCNREGIGDEQSEFLKEYKKKNLV